MRYLPHSDVERAEMLKVIGVKSIDELFATVPASSMKSASFDLSDHMDEFAVSRKLSALAGENMTAEDVPFFIGAGAYRHHIPASIDHLIQRSEWLTAYTPYQPEISQGTLQALFEFQTQVAMITAMEVANASMYDGATATAEAVLMAARITRRAKALLSGGLHPHYRDVCRTSARFLGLDALPAAADWRGTEDLASLIDGDTACVVVQNPNFYGHLSDLTPLAEACHEAGALLVVVVNEVLSLGAINPPGLMDADIVAAEGQSIGNAPGFGGPHVGLLAARSRYLRQMPGRICGETVDTHGRRGYVLTLSTREQHIRREEATSNICTNSGLRALRSEERRVGKECRSRWSPYH